MQHSPLERAQQSSLKAILPANLQSFSVSQCECNPGQPPRLCSLGITCQCRPASCCSFLQVVWRAECRRCTDLLSKLPSKLFASASEQISIILQHTCGCRGSNKGLSSAYVCLATLRWSCAINSRCSHRCRADGRAFRTAIT